MRRGTNAVYVICSVIPILLSGCARTAPEPSSTQVHVFGENRRPDLDLHMTISLAKNATRSPWAYAPIDLAANSSRHELLDVWIPRNEEVLVTYAIEQGDFFPRVISTADDHVYMDFRVGADGAIVLSAVNCGTQATCPSAPKAP